GAAMAYEKWTVDGVSHPIQRLRNEPQLHRRAAESVDQQHADATSGQQQRSFLFQFFLHTDYSAVAICAALINRIRDAMVPVGTAQLSCGSRERAARPAA